MYVYIYYCVLYTFLYTFSDASIKKWQYWIYDDTGGFVMYVNYTFPKPHSPPPRHWSRRILNYINCSYVRRAGERELHCWKIQQPKTETSYTLCRWAVMVALQTSASPGPAPQLAKESLKLDGIMKKYTCHVLFWSCCELAA